MNNELFTFQMPTAIKFGRGILNAHPETLALGKRAYIVTGAHSGEKSGALSDTVNALKSLGISYEVFNNIGNNPNVVQCKQVGEAARVFNADFIIGIGGGSPLDAAKAIAVFASNNIEPERIFSYGYDNPVLPIVAIPTTSGTGSEVTPWSIMTRDDVKTKQSFGGYETFPKVAILDPAYTDSLPYDITVNTALDAFTHCFESFISVKAEPFTDAVNLQALKLFYSCLTDIDTNNITADTRDKLMLVSMMGGFTISNTGTTTMHAMGYPLTYFHNVPHGAANCLTFIPYVNMLKKHRPARLNEAVEALGMSTDTLTDFMLRHFAPTFALSDEEIAFYSKQVAAMGNAPRAGFPTTESDVKQMYCEVFR